MNAQSQLNWFYTLPDLIRENSREIRVKWRVSNRAKANVFFVCSLPNHDKEATVARTLYQQLKAAVPGDVIVENWTAFLSRYVQILLSSGIISSEMMVDLKEGLVDIVKSYFQNSWQKYTRSSYQKNSSQPNPIAKHLLNF